MAFESYRGLAFLGDTRDVLNLAWTADEWQLLPPRVHRIIERRLQAELSSGLATVREYAVQDPHGTAALGPAVAGFFHDRSLGDFVTCGAGISSLLPMVVQIGRGRPVYLADSRYPDLFHWASSAGIPVIVAEDRGKDVDRIVADVRRSGAGCVFVERPAVIGGALDDLGSVAALCTFLQDVAQVVIDESNANYCPPSYSAVPLTRTVDNLVVLRGLTKGYGLGGVRVGFCVSSSRLAATVRALVPPLLASPLSLAVAAAVLQAGDATTRLRAAIQANKPVMARALQDRSPVAWTDPSPWVPFFIATDVERATRFLARASIIGKTQELGGTSAAPPRSYVRISVPVEDRRFARLLANLEAARGGTTQA
jgi:histidinol-phosphate/aromatic aminotransferase/cobyric acid decarboxylase-like protein